MIPCPLLITTGPSNSRASVREFQMDFVTVLKVIAEPLKDAAFAPSDMGVVEHFTNGLKPNVRKFDEDQAAPGWWTEPEALHGKAILFEVNQLSHSLRVQAHPRCTTHSSAGRGYSKVKELQVLSAVARPM